MKFISLFSGIGGLDLGLERAGLECVAQVEKDDYCRRVLAKHWPHVLRHDDVKTFDRSIYDGPVDLIAGGFPCQPHSVAGKQRGADDDRDLWPDYRRIVGLYKPRWVLAENVPGIKDTILDEVLSDLESMDYTHRTLIVPACAFDAPHIRYRVFIVAHAQGEQGGRVQQRGIQAHAGAGNQDVAHAESVGRLRDRDIGQGETTILQRHDAHAGGSSIDDATHAGCERLSQPEHEWKHGGPIAERGWWATEPSVGRVAYGIPHRVDRLRGLGNAVVPQVAEWIGRIIMEVA